MTMATSKRSPFESAHGRPHPKAGPFVGFPVKDTVDNRISRNGGAYAFRCESRSPITASVGSSRTCGPASSGDWLEWRLARVESSV